MRSPRRAIFGLAFGLLLPACTFAVLQPECEPKPAIMATAISCDQAVTFARSQLPSDHPHVTRIQSLYGEFRPIIGMAVSNTVVPPTRAYVVFTYAGGSRVAVPLIAWKGHLQTNGDPQPY